MKQIEDSVLTIPELVKESFQTARSTGWWEQWDRNLLEQAALFHSEISEWVEDIRHGKQPHQYWFLTPEGGIVSPLEYAKRTENIILKPCGPAIELADELIRIGDTCGRYEVDLNSALRFKLAYNKTRPYRHGGKTA